MSKKDKKKQEKKLEKKALKAASKKAKKDKIKEAKAAELAEELRTEREAVLDLEEPMVEDVPAVVGKADADVAEMPAPSAAYTPVEGEKLQTISLKMPQSLVAATDEAAAVYGDGVSRSEFIRIAIEKMINE